MDELYVKIFCREDESSCFRVPLDSLVTLFTLKHCRGAQAHLVLVKCATQELAYTVNLSGLPYEIQEEMEVVAMAQSCRLPLVLLADNATCIAGLCAVLRQVIKMAPKCYHHLLGFRQGCLMACAEVSLWTRFCEVDVIKTVDSLMGECFTNVFSIPEDVVRFEFHMNQPLRIHNVQKKRQELEKAKVIGEEIVEHAFAEGPSMTLSDLILIPCFHIILKTIGNGNVKKSIPLTMAWFNKMMSNERISDAIKLIAGIEMKVENETECNIPYVAVQSLYKSDPKRYKPANRIFTKQDDIDVSLKIVSDLGLVAPWLVKPLGWDTVIDWPSIPKDAHPEGGHLPASRLDRKREQLENLTRAVMTIAKPGDVIVDFCSGSGHLGLLLAVLLPRCRVLLLENKYESLNRARTRGTKLSLDNVSYLQSNLDYFVGRFNVGVALHACGAATDLVIERCIARRASFVCCPCCYGGVQPSHAVTYPRSKLLRASALTVRDYLVLGHAADQTHGAAHGKSAQGNRCMALIDADRCLAAQERGYVVTMAKLDPLTCTPKNNLLVGVLTS